MSGYAAGAPLDDAAALEQLQNEYQRRQQLQAAANTQTAAFSALARAQSTDYGTSLLESQYYRTHPVTAAVGTTAPYTRATNPYSAIADARVATAYQASPQVTSDATLASSLYGVIGARPLPQTTYAYASPAPTYTTAAAYRPVVEQRYGYSVATGSVATAPAPYDAYAATTPYSAATASPAAAYSKPKPVDPNNPNKPRSIAKAPPIRPQSRKREKKELMQLPKRTATKDGKILVNDGATVYYTGCLPLGLDDDKYWLSELQVYLRENFEAFAAADADIAAPMHGRNKPIALGQVGIRCKHCKNDNPAERGQQATSYPSLISGIYNSVQQMLRLHLDCCLSMPQDVRMRIEQLKVSCSSRGGRKQYWVDSARRLGLIDTANGIHFGRDPYGPLPPLTGPSVNSKEGRRKRMLKATAEAAAQRQAENRSPEQVPTVENRPLVFPEDKPLISDYLYLTLEQMAPCTLMEADRVGCYKTRKVGFPGLACKHCVGQAGCGRYFPASEASLSQTTTSQTIMNHVRNCRRCPAVVREDLEIMKRSKIGPNGKKHDKPKHGGRKVFFHRLWCRIQGLAIEDFAAGESPDGSPRKKRGGKRRGRRKKIESDSEDISDHGMHSGSDSLGESEDESPRGRRRNTSPRKRAPIPESPWVEGCVRLSRTDDTHELSEMECFARTELVEVFSLKSLDDVDGYNGRKAPAIGQVGLRCIFCKSLDPVERPTGCLSFPESIETIHVKATDMIRLHFPSCPALSAQARKTFKSLRGFDAKVASDDALQYWTDSARDLGLSNRPVNKDNGWGITFRRDPMEPSPADELDLDKKAKPVTEHALVKESDREMCTDQAFLLLQQIQPCVFEKSDRKSGTSNRSRDRSLGTPGLECRHCAGRGSLGRYFPASPKNLTDTTSNSLLTHVSHCSLCPESIKASLAYLGHRSIQQKVELRGCWKKTFYKKIWDRMFAGGVEEEDNAALLSDGEYSREGSDSDREEVGDHMNALIKAAAIWLTEQDAASDRTSSRTSTKPGRNVNKRNTASPTPPPRASKRSRRTSHY